MVIRKKKFMHDSNSVLLLFSLNGGINEIVIKMEDVN